MAQSHCLNHQPTEGHCVWLSERLIFSGHGDPHFSFLYLFERHCADSWKNLHFPGHKDHVSFLIEQCSSSLTWQLKNMMPISSPKSGDAIYEPTSGLQV